MPPEGHVEVDLDGDDEAVLDRVHDALARLWRSASDVDETDRIALETAVVEVAGNVVRHGAAGPGRHLALTADARRLVAEVTQPGPPPPLDLAAAMPGSDQESGRGLALTRLLVDLTCAERAGATVWTLARPRS
ncbi:ATP-binding protein [Cellulomonas massiliensis]|uniref:ATP-binding protein n=1 Tax=Cellulomonas massiliensis TaxID=1465811 RepID=UPI00031C8D1E|nr:ATP-binding protein [Cellulomonas massiliensis]